MTTLDESARLLGTPDKPSAPMEGYPDESFVFHSPQEFGEWLRDHPLPDTPGWTPEMRDVWLRLMPSAAYYPSTVNKFNTVGSYDKAMALLQNGWPKGRDRMLEWEGQVMRAFHRQVELPHFKMGEEGSDIDMGRFTENHPEHMLGYGVTETDKQSPLITVDMNLGCVACEARCCEASPPNPDWLMMRGAVLFLLVRLMRQAGLYPEVWLGTVAFYDDHAQTVTNEPYDWEKAGFERAGGRDRYDGSGYYYDLPKPMKARKRTTLIRALGPDSFLDPSVLAFVLAHDGLIRRLQFRMEEVLNFQECGPFPMHAAAMPGSPGIILGQHSPVNVGGVPSRSISRKAHRDSPEAQPNWSLLVSPGEARSHIHLPAMSTLNEMMYGDKREEVAKAIGAFDNPEGAAEYMLQALRVAGVRLNG